MSFPRYMTEHVYSAAMHSPPGGTIVLYRDRGQASKESGIPMGLVPVAKVVYETGQTGPSDLPAGTSVHRWVLTNKGTFAHATDWYVSPSDATEECHVLMRKREFAFDSVTSQAGTIA